MSQIITKNLITGVTFEVITDQGLLSNPYRSIRYLDPTGAAGLLPGHPGVSQHAHQHRGGGAREVLSAVPRGGVALSYRYFSDTWGIHANTIETGLHPAHLQPSGF